MRRRSWNQWMWIAAAGLLLPATQALSDPSPSETDTTTKERHGAPSKTQRHAGERKANEPMDSMGWDRNNDRMRPMNPQGHDSATRDRRAGNLAAAPSERSAEERSYVVQKGDTLGSIAAAELGSAKKWKLIARANDFDDPNELEIGRRIRIPKEASAKPREDASRDRDGMKQDRQGRSPSNPRLDR